MHSFQELLTKFEQFSELQLTPVAPKDLYESYNYLLQIGGKRIRPIVCIMCNEMFEPISNDAYNASYAIELFHNFTLVHDDIMDKAPIRRGKETVHLKYNTPTAILCGDVMNIYAYSYLNKIDTKYLKKVLQTFNTCAIQICEGQQLDMQFENSTDVSIEQYIEMITLKTSVLLASSMKIGAILGGASEGTANYLYEVGKNIGIAFQLKDDYLDSFGNAEKVGKKIGGDILANKKTYLLVAAIHKANTEQLERIHLLLANDRPDKVETMLGIYKELEVDKDIQALKEHYSNKAFEFLDNAPILKNKKTVLTTLTEELLLREY